VTRRRQRLLALAFLVAATGSARAASPPAAIAAPAATATGSAAIPAHPRLLQYPPFRFEVPRAERYRHVLRNGVTVYVVEDHALPLVSVNLQARLGSFLDPPGKLGVAEMTGAMLRQGGAGEWTAEQLDERADTLAADLGSSTGDISGGASVDCLTSVLPDCLDLLFAMVEKPRFQADRLQIAKDNLREEMKQRNDEPGAIEGREWQWLLYGNEHFTSRLMTAATLDAITREDLVAFHAAYWRPRNLVVAVSGDVQTDAVLAALERHFAGWSDAGAAAVPWPPPPPRFVPTPGLYHVEKDIPQARVSIGHRSRQWDPTWSDPRDYAAMVMNYVLGGGGFISHITRRIRSEEGLAYHAGSSFEIGPFWPGAFAIDFESKNETVAYAIQIALEELRAIRDQPPTAEEVQIAEASFVEGFPRRFESAEAIANLFASDDLIGRPHEYWYRYRERLAAVTPADVQAVAREALHADQLVVLVVGPWQAIAAGDPQGRATMDKLGLGDVRHLPLRDPLTLRPLP
jgi:predicted Zn-dependent peptidase